MGLPIYNLEYLEFVNPVNNIIYKVLKGKLLSNRGSSSYHLNLNGKYICINNLQQLKST